MYKEKYNIILELIFDRPIYKFHIREIARLTNIHPNIVINAVDFLKKEELIRVERKKHLVEVFANLEGKKFIRKKRAYNFDKLYSSGLVEYLEEEFNPDSISVIGSYGRGEDIEKSDVDIIVISGRIEKAPKIDMSKFEKIIGRHIHLIATSYKQMSGEFFNNLINGIVLYGYLRKI